MRLDQYEQREYGQRFKGNGVTGKKHRRLDGELAQVDDDDNVRSSCKPPSNTQPPSAKMAKGPWLDGGRFVTSIRPPVPQKRLSDKAIKLLGDYHRRRAFWVAVEEHGASIEFAGKELLGVEKRRAYDIYNEMPDGPLIWFAQEFARHLSKGTISQGRATEPSPIAEHFFCQLAGGRLAFDQLRHRLGGRRKTVAEEVLSDMDLASREAMAYGIWAQYFLRDPEDN
jgi:hypothetical protein